jgi:hypothetical protein
MFQLLYAKPCAEPGEQCLPNQALRRATLAKVEHANSVDLGKYEWIFPLRFLIG